MTTGFKNIFFYHLLIISLPLFSVKAQEKPLPETQFNSLSRYLNKASDLKYSNWQESQKYINAADALSEESKNEEMRAFFYKEAGGIFYDRDIFDISLKYNMKAYAYYIKKDKTKASDIENLIAIINARLNNKELALLHFKNIYENNKQDRNNNLAAKALNNIGTIYLDSKKIDSALIFYQKAINEAAKINDTTLFITSNNNLARVYTEKKDNIKASETFKYTESLLTKIQDPYLHALVYNNMADFYIKTNNAPLAIKYAELAKSFSKVKFSFQNKDILENLYKSYLLAGDYKKSSEYFQLYDDLRDSLNIEEKAVNVEREKIEFEYKNKEQQLELANNKKRLKLVTTVLILSLLSSVLLFLIIRYKNNLVKERLQNDLATSRENELKLDLEIKNKELASKSLLEVERSELYHHLINELNEISDLHEIEDVKKELNSIIFKLSKNKSPNNWDEFSLRFTNIYDSFYENLSKLHPDLNPNEKRLCALIKLNLNSKEIADITKTTVKSVENSRTRLRKKLGLTNLKSDLNQYISGI
ncbi:MAG: hypothetical protein ACK5MK_05265 [Dysgonomonas sp.]